MTSNFRPSAIPTNRPAPNGTHKAAPVLDQAAPEEGKHGTSRRPLYARSRKTVRP